MSSLPVAKKGEKKKPFELVTGARIGDPEGSGKILEAGDTVMLTKKQAEYLLSRPGRTIKVALDFDDDPEPADDSETKESAKPASKGEGDDGVGAASSQGAAKASGKAVSSGRTASL